MTVKQLLLLEWHSGQSGQQLPCRLAKVGDGGAAAGGGGGTCQRNRCILVLALLWQVEVAGSYQIPKTLYKQWICMASKPQGHTRMHPGGGMACHNCLPLQLAQLQCSGGLSLSLGRFPLSVYVFLEERRVHV